MPHLRMQSCSVGLGWGPQYLNLGDTIQPTAIFFPLPKIFFPNSFHGSFFHTTQSPLTRQLLQQAVFHDSEEHTGSLHSMPYFPYLSDFIALYGVFKFVIVSSSSLPAQLALLCMDRHKHTGTNAHVHTNTHTHACALCRQEFVFVLFIAATPVCIISTCNMFSAQQIFTWWINNILKVLQEISMRYF